MNQMPEDYENNNNNKRTRICASYIIIRINDNCIKQDE